MKRKSSIKILSILGLVVLFCGPVFASQVQAHILKTDGAIGAVLHIDPEDDPIAGQQAGFFFEFKDKNNQFQPQDCDCTFSILEGGSQIFSQPIFQNNTTPSLTSASIFFTFPKRDVYQVEVVGKPNIPGAFQPFTLVYNIRVDRQAAGASNQSTQTAAKPWFIQYGGVLAIGATFLVLAGLYAILSKKKEKKNAI